MQVIVSSQLLSLLLSIARACCSRPKGNSSKLTQTARSVCTVAAILYLIVSRASPTPVWDWARETIIASRLLEGLRNVIFYDVTLSSTAGYGKTQEVVRKCT